ncbi:hypothetical protein WDZ92_33025 [Nostoc sp. NIES-2111]
MWLPTRCWEHFPSLPDIRRQPTEAGKSCCLLRVQLDGAVMIRLAGRQRALAHG